MLLAIERVRRIAEAEQIAGQALEAAGSAGPDAERRALVALAWARILRGRGIQDLVERSAAISPGTASLYDSAMGRPAGGRLAFRGELAQARELFVWEHTAREGVDDPGAFPVAGDLAEALAEAGRPQEAREVTGRLGRLAATQRHPWGLATVARSAAVVTLAEGYDQEAAAGLAEAAAAYRALGLGFDAARTLLVLGRAQRRAKKRAAARQSLEQARSAFEALGCPGWAQEAAAELDRVSGRRAAPGGGLTLGEQGVAELAASGLSNKQIAAQLYLSVHTVQAHLSRVYAKLGVRSRGQLARRLGSSA